MIGLAINGFRSSAVPTSPVQNVLTRIAISLGAKKEEFGNSHNAFVIDGSFDQGVVSKLKDDVSLIKKKT